MLKAHAGKVAAARQIGEGGGVITLGANDRCKRSGAGRNLLIQLRLLGLSISA